MRFYTEISERLPAGFRTSDCFPANLPELQFGQKKTRHAPSGEMPGSTLWVGGLRSGIQALLPPQGDAAAYKNEGQ